MNKVEFDYYRADSRKDLITFVEEKLDKEVLKHIGENPRAWIDELEIVNNILTGNNLIGGTGINPPPINEPEFKNLGNGISFYDGKYSKLKGLWLRRDEGKQLEDITEEYYEWTHYRMESRAKLRINKEFSSIPFETFLPENFEQKATHVEKEEGATKRPILTFPINLDGRNITIYAKGADTAISYYNTHGKPSYRLTGLAGVTKTNSRTEMETTLKLRSLGVKVPRVAGYYEALVEEFLFLEEVKGNRPDQMLERHRSEIIKQDAEMLAKLCLAGYRKCGFTDFDDKIFDGQDLYLIDVDECRDLYFTVAPDFREILLNTTGPNEVRRFRSMQRNMFKGQLKDAIYSYQNNLTQKDSDKAAYIESFHRTLGWKAPTEKEISHITTFQKNYETLDSFMAIMCDTD